MTLRRFKLDNLGKKLELKGQLEQELETVKEDIDNAEGEKKVKIKRTSPKGIKSPEVAE